MLHSFFNILTISICDLGSTWSVHFQVGFVIVGLQLRYFLVSAMLHSFLCILTMSPCDFGNNWFMHFSSRICHHWASDRLLFSFSNVTFTSQPSYIYRSFSIFLLFSSMLYFALFLAAKTEQQN